LVDIFNIETLKSLEDFPNMREIRELYYDALIEALGDRSDVDIALGFNGGNSYNFYYRHCKRTGNEFHKKEYVHRYGKIINKRED
jgi:hypothetical protein